jgi:polyhydroxybutyrate depolymerase
LTFDVAGTERSAQIIVPANTGRAAPLVFVFHGHGGRGAQLERQLDMEGAWPDAVAVYPDGLTGHKGITDAEGVRTGWQTQVGELGDRDLALYDAMRARLERDLDIDPARVYVMGHSNGSQFAALLVNQRGGGIAAVAHLSAPPAARLIATDPVRPTFIAMGTHDTIVPFADQQRVLPLLRQHLGGVELVTLVYDGGHAPPPGVATSITAFFRRHTLPVGR